MNHVDYFKMQAKLFLKDFKTQYESEDEVVGFLYDYKSRFFDMDEIVISYDIGEKHFTLMNAQHIIALMSGFKSWKDFLDSSDSRKELGRLLLENRNNVNLDDWLWYISDAERKNNLVFDDEARLAIFKRVFLNIAE